MLDHDLKFAENQRPLTIPGNSVPIALFGSQDPPNVANEIRLGVTLTGSASSWPNAGLVNYYDLRTIQDWARGRAVYAAFRLATAFAGDAANVLRPCIVADSVAEFTNVLSGYRIIAAGHTITTAGVGAGAVGSIIHVPLPPMSDWTRSLGSGPDYSDRGMRFLALGFEYNVPTTDWTAGGLDAWLTYQAIPTRPPIYPAGY